MNKYINKHKYKNESKLRNMHNQNPKQYWSFINSLKSKTTTELPSLDQLYNFFKRSNANDNADEPFDLPHDLIINGQEQLNCSFTENEIEKHITYLKSAKAPSPADNIVNEYIKSTKDIMLPIYTNLFNRIMNTV